MNFLRVWLRFWWLYWSVASCAAIAPFLTLPPPQTGFILGLAWLGGAGLVAAVAYWAGQSIELERYKDELGNWRLRHPSVKQRLIVPALLMFSAGIINAFTDTPTWLHGWLVGVFGVGGPVVVLPTSVWWYERRTYRRKENGMRQARIEALEKETLE